MNKRFTKLIAALALLVFMTPSLVGWGQTYEQTTTISVGDVVILVCESKTAEMGTVASYGASVVYTTNPAGAYPLTVEAGYSDGTYSFRTSTNKYLSWTSGNSLNLSDTKNANSSWIVSFSNNNVLINNSHDDSRKLRYNASSPRFACYTSDQTAIQLYKAIASAVVAPTITPNSQSFVNELEVTITPAEGTTAYYTTNGTDPDNSGTGYTTAHSFTINQTTEVRAIAYNGTESSSIVTKEYTKVTPLANIAALTANTEADTYYVTMDNAVVTYVNGNYAYIQDATGAVVMYKSGHGLDAGNVLNGTATVAYQVRNGNPQITDLSGITPTPGTAPEPTEVAASAWNYTFENVLSQYFKVTGASITQNGSKYYVSLNNENVQLYKANSTIGSLDLNRTYTIIGFPTLYNTTKELQVFDDPMVEETTEPFITVDPATAEAFTYVVENGPSEEQIFEVMGENLTSTDIVVSVAQDGAFEITDNEEYGYTLTIASGDMFSVRMKTGLEVGNYSGSVTLSSEGANDVTIALTGSVTEPEAPHYTWDLSTNSYVQNPAPTEDLIQWICDYATMKNEKGTGTAVNNYIPTTRTSTRFYNGNNLTIAPTSGYAITSVEFTATSDGYATALANSTWTNATASASGTSVTVTPIDGNVEMGAVIGATCGFTAVTVYYETSSVVYYNIELTVVENGTIAANKTRAQAGESITLTATPAENYYVSEWTILDGEANEIEYQGDDLTEVTFTMPASNVMVGATFATDLVSYTVTIDSDITHGSVTADKATAFENDEVTLTVTPETGYYLEDGNLIVMAGSDEVTVTKEDATNFTFIMPASDVVVLAEFTEFTGGVLYTLATTIESGKHYIIASGKDNGTVYVMGGQNSNNRAAVAQSVEDGMIMTSSLDVSEFVINGPDANGYYIIYDAEVPGYLFAPVSGNNNYLRTQQFNDNKGQWTISIDADNSEANVVANAEGRNTMRYNSSNNVFSCYASGQQPIYLYEKDGETEYTFYKDITGFGEAENGNYYLIASPVAVAPANVNQMIAQTAENYDLYAFDQSEAKEWLNYKQHNFSLDPGTGYLYANSENVTLSFSGEKNNTTSVTLTKTEDEVDFQGWNLIGNPYGQAAYITKDYYRMNETGDEVIEGSGAINPMEGVFVIAESDGQTVTFSTENNAKAVEQVVMNVTRNRGTAIDRAIVRFDEGQQLPKFQLNPESTKLYIAQGNKDYAVVRSAAQGEMPVSFRAAENGTYTLSIETENVEMEYLHLIDNMTGMDVDLLATPSYSFEAKTTDYASRFRLAFSANGIDEQNAETFAFFNGSEWMVSNLGEATLQVVDVMGRVLSTETISDNAELSLNQPAGVYMLRLINGNDVKVQKVIVK